MDDYSDYDYTEHSKYCTYVRSEEKYGREGYYKQWDRALKIARDCGDDLLIFMPDDFSNLDYNKIVMFSNHASGRLYSFNLINDGREQSFRQYRVKDIRIKGEDCKLVGFNDCGFFTNRKTMQKVKFYMNKISPERFKNRPALSSGVGDQLTTRMRAKNVLMYMPIKSLAYHGDHDSVMHYEERKENPLISK
jgi:hypothetical protein